MAIRTCAVLICGLTLCAVSSRAQRLPGGVLPEHYGLTITPDLNAATFTGTERIDVVLQKPTRAITLNAAELNITSVHAQRPSQAEQLAGSVSLNPAREQATLSFERELPAGAVTLSLEYSGKLNDKLRGFYLSRTRQRRYGITQFESTDARRAFPSFDEPALKATFDVSLVISQADKAISNTRAVSDAPGPQSGSHIVTFATTPRMSTYLLAWLVGDFACSEGRSDGVPIRVCATPDKVGLTKFALEAAKWDLQFYNRYFGIRYPLTKLDLIAVPDFDAGAMENFGCITFRESELLVDEKTGTLPARKDVTTTVAHEIAHQWFGDLVTPEWWNNLWLNEGFATWMESKAAAQQHPGWRFEEDAALGLDHAMADDASDGTRPIRARADTPAQIDSMFDEIAYDKAGAVIGMVEHWVGEEMFRRGVQQYLRDHLYGSATAEDFWNTQSQVSGLPVDAVMRSFVEQPGVPIVNIGGVGAGAPVAQERFVAGDRGTAPLERAQSWTIPLCYTSGVCRVLGPGAITGDVPGSGFYANAGQKGYYRTSYAPQLMAGLLSTAETALRPVERIGLLGDRWALMRAGRTPVGQVLDLAFAMKSDPDPQVLEDVLSHLDIISTRIATGDDQQRLFAVIRSRIGPLYTPGEPPRHESDDHAEIREALFEALGRAGDPAVLADAVRISSAMLEGKQPADPGLADAAVALAAPQGNADMYDRLVRVVEHTTDPELRETAQRLLTRFRSPELVMRTLNYALSGDVRTQDRPALLAGLLGNADVQEQAWQFVQQNWNEILRKGPPDSADRLVSATAAFCSVAQQRSAAAFFSAHPVEGTERTLRRSLQQIGDCARVREFQQPLLHQWLDEHQQ